MDRFTYSGEKTRTFPKCIQLARVDRKDRKSVGKNGGKRKNRSRERSNFWAIAGQFRRVPNPPPVDSPRSPSSSCLPATRPLSRSTAETDVARDRAILHPPALSVSHLSARVQDSDPLSFSCCPSHSTSLFVCLSFTLHHVCPINQPTNQPPGRTVCDGGFVYTQPTKNHWR